MESDVKVVAGEQWVECFSELPVRVTAAYEAEVHVTWERDGLKSVLPRDFFVDLFFPSYLLEAK